MGHERPGERAAGDRLHHRRLDLEEAAVVIERARSPRRRGCARSNTRRDSRIDDQIEIALAVAGLDVLQAVPLLRQRQEALGEKRDRRGADGQLVGLGPEQRALDADEVAEIEQLGDLEVALRQGILRGGRPARARRRPTGRESWPCRSCGCRGRGPATCVSDGLRVELGARRLAVAADQSGDRVRRRRSRCGYAVDAEFGQAARSWPCR